MTKASKAQFFNLLVMTLFAVGPAYSAPQKLPIYGGYEQNLAFTPHVMVYGKAGSYCSGVLVSQDKVLTAGHCFNKSRSSSGYLVYSKHKAHKVKSIDVNPLYNPNAEKGVKALYDLTVITLKRPLKGITPLAILNDSFRVHIGTEYVFFGYGVRKNKEKIIEYRGGSANLRLFDIDDNGNLLATTHSDSESSICPGDSGGGLLYDDSSPNLLVAIGILGVNQSKNGKCVLSGEGDASGASFYLNLLSEPARSFLSAYPDIQYRMPFE